MRTRSAITKLSRRGVEKKVNTALALVNVLHVKIGRLTRARSVITLLSHRDVVKRSTALMIMTSARACRGGLIITIER